MDSLHVVEVTQISPPPGFVGAKSLPCTYFDLLFLDEPPAQFLFFYASPQPKTILPDLKSSLSLALKHYYPFAGYLKWPPGSTKPHLTYTDGDSVTLTVAEYKFDFGELSGTGVQNVSVLAPLAQFRVCSGEKQVPLAAFQITFLGDKGICIGITFNHFGADAKTMFSFIKAWASLCASSGACSIKDFLLPLYDRSTILKGLEKNETVLLKLFKESNVVSSDTFHTVLNAANSVPNGLVHATFIMRSDFIQRVKILVSASIGNRTDKLITPLLHLSSYSVACAYIWVCFIKARWGKRGDQCSLHHNTEHLIIPVDIRARLPSPVPLTYFGNCGASLEVKAERRELLGEQGLVIAAKFIARGIQNIDVHAELEKYASYYASLPPEHILSLGSYPKFGAYETDFGWGKPKRVRTNMFLKELVCMLLNDCPDDEGGIEIGFFGKPIEIDAFADAFASGGVVTVASTCLQKQFISPKL